MNLTSPNYPGGYYFHDLSCNYTITAPEGYKVLVEFREFWVHPSDNFMIEDSVFAGLVAPITNYTSEDETMQISLESDAAFVGAGFWLQVSAYDCTGM